MNIIGDLKESVSDPVKAVYLQIINFAEPGSVISFFSEAELQ